MIPHVRRMVPGMLASLLLAAPVGVPHAFACGPSTLLQPRKQTELRRASAQRHTRTAQRRRFHHHHAAAPTVAFFDDGPSLHHAFWQQSGLATWYGGPRWQGRPTASGVRYEQDGLTAAHASLPLGTRVRVTLEGTGRSVIVTINDRPGSHRIVIDLSRGAARALGMIDRGIAPVTLTAAN